MQLAVDNVRKGHGGPFGAIIVAGNRIIGRGNDRVTAANDPTAHAEVVAIRDACQKLGRFHLDGAVLYASCEPCAMCWAAACWAHIEYVYYAATSADAAHAGFDNDRIKTELGVWVVEGSPRMVKLPHPQEREPFVAWLSSAEKAAY